MVMVVEAGVGGGAMGEEEGTVEAVEDIGEGEDGEVMVGGGKSLSSLYTLQHGIAWRWRGKVLRLFAGSGFQ